MLDSLKRNIDYIRISVTDRCNLRCRYCMPEKGIPLVDHEEILRYGEIIRLADIFSSLGISKIKLTWRESLVRKGLPGIRQVTLTTNGTLLRD